MKSDEITFSDKAIQVFIQINFSICSHDLRKLFFRG